MFGFFEKLGKKTRDPFYEEIGGPHVPVYQKYFLRVLACVDLDVQTNWSRSRPFDRKRMKQDEDAMHKLIAVEAVREGVHPALLQVMVNQFFFADPHAREADRTQWAERVLNRRNPDYFPDGWAMKKLLNAVT